MLIVWKNCQNRLLLKHATFTIDCRSICNRVHGHIDYQYYLHSIKSTFSQLSLPSLHPLRHSCDNYSRASTSFLYFKWLKRWAGPGNEAAILWKQQSQYKTQCAWLQLVGIAVFILVYVVYPILNFTFVINLPALMPLCMKYQRVLILVKEYSKFLSIPTY